MFPGPKNGEAITVIAEGQAPEEAFAAMAAVLEQMGTGAISADLFRPPFATLDFTGGVGILLTTISSGRQKSLEPPRALRSGS